MTKLGEVVDGILEYREFLNTEYRKVHRRSMQDPLAAEEMVKMRAEDDCYRVMYNELSAAEDNPASMKEAAERLSRTAMRHVDGYLSSTCDSLMGTLWYRERTRVWFREWQTGVIREILDG